MARTESKSAAEGIQQWVVGRHQAMCPIALTASLLSGKWKTNVLWHVWTCTNRFNALRRALDGLTRGALLRVLRELEADGLLSRTQLGKRPAAVEYALTPLAHSLGPILAQLAAWGRAHGTASPWKRSA